MSQKAFEIQTRCAHAPWASYNTPQIELIKYGRRIGKRSINLQRNIKEKTNDTTAEHCDLPALLKNVECSCPRRQSSSFEIGQATTNIKIINTFTSLKMIITN